MCIRIYGKTKTIIFRFRSNYTKYLKMAEPVIYRTVDSALSILKNHKDLDAVNKLLEVHSKVQDDYNENNNDSTTKHPLIILEGLDGCGKSTLARKLSKEIKGQFWCTPPESIKSIRSQFDDHKELRVAYYALGNYIAALEVALILAQKPVVMDRFWHSTCAYALSQAVHDFPETVSMPPEGDSFYHWPSDLFKPDMVLFLDVREDVRLQRLSRRPEFTKQEDLLRDNAQFRNNLITIYKRMVNPSIKFIDGSGDKNAVLHILMEETASLIKAEQH